MKKTLSLSLLLIISTFIIGISPSPALDVPFFSQNDMRWAEDQLGDCPKWHIGWIAGQSSYLPKWAGGCATTSKAMVFNYYQPGSTDPGSLNICLTQNGGYVRGCDAPHDERNNICTPPEASFTIYVKKKKLFTTIINAELLAGRPVIAQVEARKIPSHFVVITSVNGNTYDINDPWDVEFTPRTLDSGALGSYTIKALWLYRVSESPWPMFQHDAQHTGRSRYIGSQEGNLEWIFNSKNHTDFGGFFEDQAVIAKDGTLYVPSSRSGGTVFFTGIFAIHPDGTLFWKYEVPDSVVVTPAIGSDGTIYFPSFDKNFYAINPDGTFKWKYPINGLTSASPAIGLDKTIYVSAQKLYAFNPNGILKWSYPPEGEGRFTSPAVGDDGTIYVADYRDNALYAINRDGTVKWEYGPVRAPHTAYPVLADNGTLYLVASKLGQGIKDLYAITPNGSLKWIYESPKDENIGNPAIGADGTIYLPSTSALYALGITGTVKWKYELYPDELPVHTPIIGADGTVYFTFSGDGAIYALNPDRTLKWRFVDPDGCLFAYVSIGFDRTLYATSFCATSYGHKLYAFSE